MKNYKVAFYILFGVCLSFVLQDVLTKDVHAHYMEDGFDIQGEMSIVPNFVDASRNAVQSVVHIKSKYLSNELYGVYDPFYGRRYFNQPKENIATNCAPCNPGLVVLSCNCNASKYHYQSCFDLGIGSITAWSFLK